MAVAVKAAVDDPAETFADAGTVNAELLGQIGKLGCIREGAIADLLVVDGNPLEDISVLGSGGDRLPIIMKDGRFHKRTI